MKRGEVDVSLGAIGVHVLGDDQIGDGPIEVAAPAAAEMRFSAERPPARGRRAKPDRAATGRSARHGPAPASPRREGLQCGAAVARTRGSASPTAASTAARERGLRYPAQSCSAVARAMPGLVRIAAQCRRARLGVREAAPPGIDGLAEMRAAGRGHRPIPPHESARPPTRAAGRRWHCVPRIGRLAEAVASPAAECENVIAFAGRPPCRSATACDTRAQRAASEPAV